MSDPPPRDEPVVEQAPTDSGDLGSLPRDLQMRIRQQEILAELGVIALQGATFADLLDHTARLTAEGLNAEYSKVLELLPDQPRLLVRAGVGWEPGIVGTATIGADAESPAGYALRTGKPVISNQLENEERFRTPAILMQHGIHRAMNVILQGDGAPFGVLEVDSRSPGKFSEKDISFLQGAANILGMAIERQRYERNLRAALDAQSLLMREIHHRVKNSLQVVASLLAMQVRNGVSPEAAGPLVDAGNRVAAIGRAYSHLAYDSSNHRLELGAYLSDLVSDLAVTTAPCTVEPRIEEGIRMETDRAILVALIVNELVSNAAKHAYPHEQDPNKIITVVLQRAGSDKVAVTVADSGVGRAAAGAPEPKGLGSRLTTALADQLGGELIREPGERGTTFTLTFPLEDPSRQPRAD